jgi:hypothetical protein
MINNIEQQEITNWVKQALDTSLTYKSELVRYLGISAPTLYSRLEGKYEWRKGEIALIRELQKVLVK